jgi:hypothetical protein
MIRFYISYRAKRIRILAAETARQARLTWATNALARAGMDPASKAVDLTVLTSLGMRQADAERTIHAALASAASAYRGYMAQYATEAASDSENTDTGRMSSVRR